MGKSGKKLTEQFATLFTLAVKVAKATEVDAILIWSNGPTNWEFLKTRTGETTLMVAGDSDESVAEAVDAGVDVITLQPSDAPIYEKVEQALLQSIAEEILSPGASAIVVYNAFDAGQPDTVSLIRLDEHLGRFTARDLRELITRVPIETLKTIVDLAVDIGREGREGKPVGALFVVGDSRKVLAASQPTGFDPMKGYTRKERNLVDFRVREGIKEIAQLDGAFVVSSDGTVEAACQLIETTGADVTLSKGLGTRHWAAAAVTKKTGAIAIAVSESSGTVRIFQDGEVVLRIEPFRRAMKWKTEFDSPGDS